MMTVVTYSHNILCALISKYLKTLAPEPQERGGNPMNTENPIIAAIATAIVVIVLAVIAAMVMGVLP